MEQSLSVTSSNQGSDEQDRTLDQITARRGQDTRELGLESIVSVMENQIGCDLAGEQVILDLKSGVYYGLDEVGSRIWQLLQTPTSVQKIRDTILDEYEVSSDRCERDILSLLRELASKQLIEIRDGVGD